ncbi:MAG: ATPase P [Deltaproteobacteria bacterium]|jgi:soluble P-type ATPase|nr:ATPase P [Deltaproteobacteria bacterium]MDR1296874.1 ATPase P [Deltaproteobacteria bacterium]
MLMVALPYEPELRLEYLALDYNGTLALDGVLVPGVAENLAALAEVLEIRVVTADTFGLARSGLAGLPVELTILPSGNVGEAKLVEINKLGADRTAAIGNGRNDRLMLRHCALGLAVVGPEGASRDALREARLVFNDINSALGALLNPLRLTAGLRN